MQPNSVDSSMHCGRWRQWFCIVFVYSTSLQFLRTSAMLKHVIDIQGAAKKLRFLKNLSVNLHAIFTLCKEGTCTYLDNM